MHPATGQSRDQVEHSHSGSFEIEVAAVRGHRFDDAKGKLRLIGELAWMNLFGSGFSASLISVDRPEPIGDFGPVHPTYWSTEGVADGHAEECAKELIFC